MNKKWWSYISVLLLLFLSSCGKDYEDGIEDEEGSNEYVNQWMKEQMQRYYYWNDVVPENVDLSLAPQTYFKELLYGKDPFSYTYHPSYAETFPTNLPKTYGFEMGFRAYENDIYGIILYTKPGSPAENTGLQRGVLIKEINGQTITLSNYQSLYKELVSSEQASLNIVDYSEETGFSTPQLLEIYSSFSYDDSMDYTILEEEDKKVGYVYIPHFEVGLATPLLTIFNELKSEGISELIIDLRYNGGGDVSSAAALATIIAPNIAKDDLFIKFEGNKNGGIVYQSFEEALTMNESRISYESLRSVHPNINKVYILCGHHTASASEIIINNLSPYMSVTTVGETTVGKDVAGFPIQDERNPEKPGWILYPSIYKLFNANEEGGYEQGIAPDYVEDELESLPVKALGNPEETLLSYTLTIINGNEHRPIYEHITTSPKFFTPTYSEPILIKNTK